MSTDARIRPIHNREIKSMVLSRSPQKVERVTVKLVPNRNDRLPFHVPSTFNKTARVYGWRHSARLDYMIVPTKISSTEVRVDIFVAPSKGSRLQAKSVPKLVQNLIETKVASEWRGLRLGDISRPTAAVPPQKSYVRGTIEDMLGASLER